MNRNRLIEYAKALYEEDRRIYGLSRPFNRLGRRLRKEWKEAAATAVEAVRQKLVRDMGEAFAYTLAAFDEEVIIPRAEREPTYEDSGEGPPSRADFLRPRSFLGGPKNGPLSGSSRDAYLDEGETLARKMMADGCLPSLTADTQPDRDGRPSAKEYAKALYECDSYAIFLGPSFPPFEEIDPYLRQEYLDSAAHLLRGLHGPALQDLLASIMGDTIAEALSDFDRAVSSMNSSIWSHRTPTRWDLHRKEDDRESDIRYRQEGTALAKTLLADLPTLADADGTTGKESHHVR